MNILSILNELSATSSKLEKEAILEREKNNKLLKNVFLATYNPFINYWIKQIPTYELSENLYDLDFALNELKKLSNRVYTGNAAINFLSNILGNCTKDDAVVIERIIQRDLRVGCSDTTANKVWIGLIPTFDVMLSHKDISGIKYPCYGQIKSDGARCHIYNTGTGAVATSRNGKTIELHGSFDESLMKLTKEGATLDGELLCFKDGKVLDRKTGNGIINKAIKGTISVEESLLIRFACWDKVDFTSTIPYKERIQSLVSTFDKIKQPKIFLLETKTINSEKEANDFYLECVEAGEEGAMMKNMDAVWVPKRTKNLGKMKAEESADLVVVGLEEGTGRNKGKLGAFVCQTSDALLQVKVGTGFSDEQRELFYDSSYVGVIVSVLYNQKITSKGKETASLFLPRFDCLRVDKNVANSLKELK